MWNVVGMVSPESWHCNSHTLTSQQWVAHLFLSLHLLPLDPSSSLSLSVLSNSATTSLCIPSSIIHFFCSHEEVRMLWWFKQAEWGMKVYADAGSSEDLLATGTRFDSKDHQAGTHVLDHPTFNYQHIIKFMSIKKYYFS